jgi:hypothetical protein
MQLGPPVKGRPLECLPREPTGPRGLLKRRRLITINTKITQEREY